MMLQMAIDGAATCTIDYCSLKLAGMWLILQTWRNVHQIFYLTDYMATSFSLCMYNIDASEALHSILRTVQLVSNKLANHKRLSM